MNKKKTKRWMVTILCLMLVLMISGCGKQDDDVTTQQVTEEEIGTDTKHEINSEETTDEVASTEDNEVPVDVPSEEYKSAFLNVIREHRAEIMNYNWQYGYAFYAQDVITPTPISIVDIVGDEAPELIYLAADDGACASLHICTYQEGKVKEIFRDAWDVAVAGGSYYVLFQTEGSKDLYARFETGDEWWYTSYSKYGFDGSGSYTVLKKYEEISYPNDDYSDLTYEYTEDEQTSSKETFETETQSLLDSISNIIMYNEHYNEEITALVNDNHCNAMTYLEAYNYLSEGLEDTVILEELPTFIFSSGVGGWGTSLTIYEDGSFEGSFHDSDMGDTGDGYSNGTVYLSDFRGSFSDIKKVNEYTYTMKLETIKLEKEPGTEWIEKEARYVASEPYGMDIAEEVYLYLPGAPTAELPADFVDWVSMPRGWVEENIPAILNGYGFYNPNERTGFYAE